MKPARLLAIAALACLFPAAQAGDAAIGKKKYIVCAGCHGPMGAGNAALNYPKLAGLEAGYVRQQLADFKAGVRDNATMRAMAAGLNATDMDNLAAYIATLK
jgi:cytochrome c553